MTSYTTDIWIDAPRETVFEYFTDPELFVRWQGSEAQFELQPGGRYWVAYGSAAVISGEFETIEPPERLVYLRRLNSDHGPQSRVEIEFAVEKEGTRIFVVHTDFQQDEGVEKGWPHFLGELHALLEGEQV